KPTSTAWGRFPMWSYRCLAAALGRNGSESVSALSLASCGFEPKEESWADQKWCQLRTGSLSFAAREKRSQPLRRNFKSARVRSIGRYGVSSRPKVHEGRPTHELIEQERRCPQKLQ